MAWLSILGWCFILLSCVAGLSTVFYHWALLGFEIKKTSEKVARIQFQATQIKGDIEDLKGKVE